MNASSYVQVDRMVWFPLAMSPLTYPAPCPNPTLESLTIPAPLDLPVPLRPSTVPSVSLTIAGQFIVDDTDFVEVDLADEEITQPSHSFLKAFMSRVANFFRRVKNVFKKKV
ncbi:uncharacterized protein LOC125382021 [Haliotis rufescens]|uniref:uncharacterized protein LOC125382021 n=1 Tax=Haliotis rufescens TaxID=6454 RepID=UPI00201EA293|nr:uncharacterized protein LOC125382021 [Haliotis rufescens]